MAKSTRDDSDSDLTLDRRKALAKLGLAAGVAYAAPIVIRLDRDANAGVTPTPCKPGGKGKGC